MSPAAVIHLENKREALAKRVIDGVGSIAPKLKALEDDIRALWLEFENLPKDETIAGCQTKSEFCHRFLNRTPRAIQYLFAGGNANNSKPREIISHALEDIIANIEVPLEVAAAEEYHPEEKGRSETSTEPKESQTMRLRKLFADVEAEVKILLKAASSYGLYDLQLNGVTASQIKRIREALQ